MHVTLTGGSAATAADVAEVESDLGVTFPASYREFVMEYDGAEPSANVFRVSAANESGVSGFIKIRDIEAEARHVENRGQAFPIAHAEGGNYVLIDPRQGGEVLFWDHELPDERTPLARDFTAFLESLEPFDIGSVQLKPGQVTRAWIDPDFLREQQ